MGGQVIEFAAPAILAGAAAGAGATYAVTRQPPQPQNPPPPTFGQMQRPAFLPPR